MNNIEDVEKLARDLIEAKIKSGEIVTMEWAVNGIIQSQGEIDRAAAYHAVKKVFDAYDPNEQSAALKKHAAEIRNYVASRRQSLAARK